MGLDRHIEGGDRFIGDKKLGFAVSARAIPMRCRWPPENACGTGCSVGVQSDGLEQLLDSRQALFLRDDIMDLIGAPTRSPTVCVGFSEV